jgi:hypothetical protein
VPVPKNKYHCLLADPPEIYISKISEDANRKMFGGFFGKFLRMQKPQIKFARFTHLEIALGCGPGRIV